MVQETTLGAVPAPPRDGEAPPGPEAALEATRFRPVWLQEGSYRVVWDELPPPFRQPWPDGGTVLFLWPQARGDLRRPAWSRPEDDDEDEYDPWWNREDNRVSAALLRPHCDDLLAFLAEQAGPPRFEFGERLEALRAYLRRLDPGHPLRAIASTFLNRPLPLDQLVSLVEGAGEFDRSRCTVRFGAPARAVLHARRNERCLWLWVARDFEAAFERFREEAGPGGRFLHSAMDWARTGDGLLAPRPPESLGSAA